MDHGTLPAILKPSPQQWVMSPLIMRRQLWPSGSRHGHPHRLHRLALAPATGERRPHLQTRGYWRQVRRPADGHCGACQDRGSCCNRPVDATASSEALTSLPAIPGLPRSSLMARLWGLRLRQFMARSWGKASPAPPPPGSPGDFLVPKMTGDDAKPSGTRGD